MNAKYRSLAALTLLMVIVLILFESAQQYYYILQFDLASSNEISIWELGLAQAYRWFVWLIISVFYFGFIIYKGKSDRIFSFTKTWPAIQHLILIIILNVIIISMLQLILNNRGLTLENIWENCVFYYFQKTPIYTLAHGAMLGLFHMVNTNQHLALEILDLKDQAKTGGTQSLSIKIGNKSKVIPVSEIIWIEAYDYCVKIHTTNQHTYAMRNSLKALEKKMSSLQFLRVHRKALVNMDKVSEVTYNSSPFLTLMDQTKIDIAQSRISDVKAYLQTVG